MKSIGWSLSFPLSKEAEPRSESSLKVSFFFLFPGNSKTFSPADGGDPSLLNPQQVDKQIQEERSGLGHQKEKGGGNFPGLWQHQMSFNYSSLFVAFDKSFHKFPKNNALVIGSLLSVWERNRRAICRGKYLLPHLSNDQNYRLTGKTVSSGSDPAQCLPRDKSEKKGKKKP